MSNPQEIQQQYKSFRKELYTDYPEVEKFEKTKGNWLKFLLLFCLFIDIAQGFLNARASDSSTMYVTLRTITNFGVHLIFLTAGMGPRWRIAFVLYLLGFAQIFNSVFNFTGADFYAMGIHSLACIFALLVLIIAVFLTLIPKNRELAEQSEKLNAKLREFISAHPIQ